MGETGDEETPWVALGKLGKTHGVKGWIRVHSYTDTQSNIADYKCFTVIKPGHTVVLQLEEIKPHGNSLIARFKGFEQPEDYKDLVGTELLVESSQLPPLTTGEYYWHQLEGLQVINLQAEDLGKIDHLLATGANDVMVVRASETSIDERERLIPYLSGSVIQQIDLQAGTIIVDWQADFLT